MEKNQKDDKIKKRIRFPLMGRISVLIFLAMLLAVVLVAVVSQNSRMKRAIQQGGESARQACAIVRNFLEKGGYDEGFFRRTEDDNYDEYFFFREIFFPEICEGMDLKYLYLFTIDQYEKRHHIVTVARDRDDQVFVDEIMKDQEDGSQLPLQDNEKNVMKGTTESELQEVNNKYGHVVNCVMGYRDENGKLLVLIGADYDMDYVMEIMKKNSNYLLIIGLTAIAITFFLVLIMIHIWVIRPIRGLSRHMHNFMLEKDIQLPPSKSHFRDEVTDMESSFRKMAENLKMYVADIQKLASEKAESDVQLQVAHKIQNGMVPPEKEYSGRGCSVYAVMHPALEVGGDFYDVFELPMGKVGILIGDISGKGIGAALFMSIVRRIVRERLRTGMLPAKALKRANDEICRENPEGFFATVFAASWDPMSGKLTYANAGHNPPIRFGSKTEELPIHPGDLLGIFEDAYFRNETMNLEIGEGILLYTDGVTEALNSEHTAYGEKRLLELVSHLEPDSKEIVKTVRNDVLGFEGEDNIFDDITLIAMRRVEMQWIRMAPELSELGRLKRYVMGFVEDQSLAKNIMTPSEEWFVNIVSYSDAKSILFDIVRENQLIKVTFADDGTPFDPTSYMEEKAFEELDTGGMGIEMIRNMTTELRYERVECRNVVTLVFKQDLQSGG